MTSNNQTMYSQQIVVPPYTSNVPADTHFSNKGLLEETPRNPRIITEHEFFIMRSLNLKRLNRLWAGIYTTVTVVFVLALIYHHWKIVSAPFPLDYYEGTTLLITQIFADGGNPYTREFQPQAMYVYPPLYNILVAPITWIFDNSLQLHRSICGLFILASCLLVGRAVYRCNSSLIDSVAASALLYAALLFYITPTASTNALGVLFYLGIVYAAWFHSFSIKSLFICAVLGIAAFYTKQYFILGVALVCSYVFLYSSKVLALGLGAAFTALVLASLWVAHVSSPYFLDDTLFTTAIAAKRLQSTEIAVSQYENFFKLYWPLLVLAFLQFSLWRRKQGEAVLLRLLRPKTFTSEEPTREISNQGVYYYWFCLLLSAVVVFFSLARNPGNYLSYLFQIMSPLLLIAVFGAMHRLGKDRNILSILVLLCYYQAWNLLSHDFSTTDSNWKKVDRIIAGGEHFLTSQILIANLLRQDRPVYQDGHTFYFPLAKDKPHWFIKENQQERAEVLWANYIQGLYRDIEHRRFDAIMVTPLDFRGIFTVNPPPFSDLGGRKFLEQYYYLEEVFPVSMTKRHGGGEHRLQVWRPRTNPQIAN